MMMSSLSIQRIFTRNLRRVAKVVVDKVAAAAAVPVNGNDGVFKTVETEVDLKSFENLSTIARLAIEENTDALRSIVGDKRILSDNKMFLNKRFELNDDYKNFRDSMLSEMNEMQVNNGDVLLEEKMPELEDPTCKISKIKCGGCGSRLQCNDKTREGFIKADLFKQLSGRELYFKLCFRCMMIKEKQKKYKKMTSNVNEYEENVLNRLLNMNERVLVILLVDLLDMPNSIYQGWSKLIQNHGKKSNIDIFVIGSKLDLLPNTGPTWKEDILKCLEKQCADKGIQGDQIKHVELISAQNGYKIEKFIDKLFDYWQYRGDVYLLGVTNAGKSVLFNRLLSSDYCQALASDALRRATTSYWPNTTLNMLKFPITRLDEKKLRIRQRRLYHDRVLEEQRIAKKYELFKKNHSIEDATLFGIVNTSFKPHSIQANSLITETDAAYSINEGGQLAEGENFKASSQIRFDQINKAREKYHPAVYRDSCFFYDTPGILVNDHVFNKFSNTEAEISVPKIMVLPRVIWMVPGQTLFVGGVIRIDLLESTTNERVLFSIMTNMRLPIIEPFETSEAERKYEELYESNQLVVPFKESSARKDGERLELRSKEYTIQCLGNFKSTADIVFSSFGWAAVTSRPDITAKVRAYTLDDNCLHLREPSLLPHVVNMRRLYCHQDRKQHFISRFTRAAYKSKK